jgi:multidrug efflux pump
MRHRQPLSTARRPPSNPPICQQPGANGRRGVGSGAQRRRRDEGARFPAGHRLRGRARHHRVRAHRHRRGRSTPCSRRWRWWCSIVYLFLQSWRTTVICLAAIAVSLVATFAGMLALGFSINPLTLFGLVLAIGLVVDDAIVVVENVERNMAEHHASRAREATVRCDAARSPGPWSRWCW